MAKFQEGCFCTAVSANFKFSETPPIRLVMDEEFIIENRGFVCINWEGSPGFDVMSSVIFHLARQVKHFLILWIYSTYSLGEESTEQRAGKLGICYQKYGSGSDLGKIKTKENSVVGFRSFTDSCPLGNTAW